jgi:peptidoglycan/LPS O-acetylase OafA/YrhL
MKFRSDVNGLRALAVLAVVLFHFSIPGFRGGFLGVDVFFVISGFLMTDIIFRGVEKGNFSVLTFYKYRARRIIPALAVLCFALLAFGWFALLPSEFRTLGKAAAGSLGFFSNIVFWREAGYFDSASIGKWLLHTWSLSIEWQFYLLYPLLIVALRKWLPASWTRLLLVAGAVLSLLLCIYLSDPTRWPTAAFYLLPPRAWEMLAGALVYLFPLSVPKRVRFALEWLGLAMIVFGILRFNADDPWPGSLALVPVVGTALVIAAARGYSVLTGNRVAQFIGKISYSVYLWHWPLVVALNYYGRQAQPVWVAGAIAGAFVLGYLSWFFVESRTRKPAEQRGTFPSYIALRPALGFAALVLLGAAGVYYGQGVPARFDRAVFIADSESYDTNPHTTKCHMLLDPCNVFEAQTSSRAIIIGDSHAEALAEALKAAVPDDKSNKNGDVILIAMQGCPTVSGIRRDNGECFDFNRKYLKVLGETAPELPPVIIVNHWSGYLSGALMSSFSFVNQANPGQPNVRFSPDQYRQHFLSTVCRLAKMRPVYIVKPIPEFDVNVPIVLAREKRVNPDAPDLTLDISDYYKRNEFVLQVMQEAHDECGVHLLDPTRYLCSKGKCMGSHDGRPLYFDMNHLSEYGNRFLVPMFKPVFSASN